MNLVYSCVDHFPVFFSFSMSDWCNLLRVTPPSPMVSVVLKTCRWSGRGPVEARCESHIDWWFESAMVKLGMVNPIVSPFHDIFVSWNLCQFCAIHQTFCALLKWEQVPRSKLWECLKKAPVFSGKSLMVLPCDRCLQWPPMALILHRNSSVSYNETGSRFFHILKMG